MLRARYSPEGTGEFAEEAYSDRVAVFDLSSLSPKRAASELFAIREKLEGRITRHEQGQTAGLSLVVMDELNAVVIFDASLIACDVRSMHTTLQELHDLYQGTLDPRAIRDLPPCDLAQLIERHAAEPAPEDEAFWKRSIAAMRAETPSLDNFAYDIDNASLAQHRYRSMNVLLQAGRAEALRRHAEALGTSPYALMFACAADALCEWMEISRFAALVPVFRDPTKEEGVGAGAAETGTGAENAEAGGNGSAAANESADTDNAGSADAKTSTRRSAHILGDFTDLGVICIEQGETNTAMAKEIDANLRNVVQHASRCTKVVQEELVANNVSPLVVFTMVPGMGIVGSPAKPALGRLSYSCSQTPQVALDVQIEDFGDGYLVHWVFPCGLFDEMGLEECVESFRQACATFERESHE